MLYEESPSIVTNIPRFWFSKTPGSDGQSSGQFNKILTSRQIENQGFSLFQSAPHYEVWEKVAKKPTAEDVASAAVAFVHNVKFRTTSDEVHKVKEFIDMVNGYSRPPF